MSRWSGEFNDDPLSVGRFEAQFRSATRSPKGQRRLLEFIGILDAMPERRLIGSALAAYSVRGDTVEVCGVCGVGAIAYATNPALFDHPSLIARYTSEGDGLAGTAEFASMAGIMPYALAWRLSFENDEGFDEARARTNILARTGAEPTTADLEHLRWKAVRQWLVGLLLPEHRASVADPGRDPLLASTSAP
jgi:hypothetical protein